MELKTISDSAFAKIRKAFLSGSDELSDDLQKVKDRWQACFNFMMNDFNSEKQVADLLVNQFDISKATAYRDIACTKKIFGDIKLANKAMERHIASERAKENYQLAKKWWEESRKSVYFYAMIEQQKLHMKVNNLDKEEIEFPDLNDIPRQEQIIMLNPDFLNNPKYASLIDPKVLQNMKKTINRSIFKDYLNNLAEDVNFIEFDDGTELETVIKMIRKLHDEGVDMKELASKIRNEYE